MGQAKHAMMDHQDDLEVAADFLISIGALQRCEYHEHIILEGDCDLDGLWPIAMAERNKGRNGRVPWAADMKDGDFTDLLKEAYEQNVAMSCGLCDKWERE